MLIVVSGSHASGKSTLISDFALRHPGFETAGDVFDLLSEEDDQPSARLFAAQLRAAADRILSLPSNRDVIVERGPLDFLAYLLAIEELSGHRIDPQISERAHEITARAMMRVDLLVVLPLVDRDGIHIDEDEGSALRSAMNAALLDLVDDGELIGPDVVVVELSGSPGRRSSDLGDAVTHLMS